MLRQPDSAAFIWYTNAFSIAVIALSPKKQRLILLLPAFLAITLSNLLFGDPVWLALLLATANTLTIAFGTFGLVKAADNQNPFSSSGVFVKFLILTVVLAPLAGTVVGGMVLHNVLQRPFFDIALGWYLGDVIGIISATPMVYLLAKRPSAHPFRFPNIKRLVAAALIAAGSGIFLKFIPFPFVEIAIAITLAGVVLDRLSAFITTFVISVTLNLLLVEHVLVLDLVPSGLVVTQLLVPIAGAMMLGSWLIVNTSQLRQTRKISEEKAQLFENAMHASVIGMVMAKPSGELMNANKSFIDLTGYDCEELTSRTFKQMLFPSDRDSIDASFYQLKTGKIDNFQKELRFLKKNKEVFWAKVSATAVRDNWTKEPIHFIYQIQNIDSERRIETERHIWSTKFSFALGINRLSIYELECHTKYISFSDNLQQVLDISPTAIRRLYEWMARIHPKDLQEYQHTISKIGESPVTIEYRLMDDRQEYRWVRDCCQPLIKDESGLNKTVVGTITDITEQKFAMDKVTFASERALLAAEVGRFGIWEYNAATQELIWDARMYDDYHLEKNAPIDVYHWKSRILADDSYKLDNLLSVEQPIKRLTEVSFYVTFEGLPNKRFFAAACHVDGERIIGVHSERSYSQDIPQQTNQSEREDFSHSGVTEGFLMLDSQLNITFINSTCETMLSLNESMVGDPLDQHVHLQVHQHKVSFLDILSTEQRQSEIKQIQRDVTIRSDADENQIVHLTITPLKGSAEADIGWVVSVRDISSYLPLRSKLTYSATHDMLTGLMNRQGFELALRNHIQELSLKYSEHAVALFRLKPDTTSNNILPVMVMEQVSKSASLLIQSSIRNNDLLARIDDLSFALLLRGCSPSEAARVTQGIAEKLNHLCYRDATRSIPVITMVGITGASTVNMHPYMVLEQAELALLAAKKDTSNSVAIYSDNDIVGESSSENVLHHIDEALKQSAFSLLCVPITPNVEGLPYWHQIQAHLVTEEGQLIDPSKFLNEHETNSKINDIERWAFNEVLGKQATKIKDAGLNIAMKLSLSSFYSDNIVDEVADLIKKSEFPASRLCVVVDEGTLITSPTQAKANIAKLRAAGCHVSVDKFGSELASVNFLKKFNISFVKLDESITGHITNNQVNRQIVESIQQISDVLNIPTIAQSVRLPEELEAIRCLGISYTQGPIFGSPVSLLKVISTSKAGLQYLPSSHKSVS
ncbi:EAL domain-containing protein [Enterovibrio sp. ZSDZ35]|uniref:EAL domain-containing protein n=1 Tax=Enterovibrio qingdaonensis TaxID=2899818 RepID=A0ABT5QTI0_9GAMM|nr:EAL domain-containing protein [Enterovibrio sp. ZSDZ35]